MNFIAHIYKSEKGVSKNHVRTRRRQKEWRSHNRKKERERKRFTIRKVDQKIEKDEQNEESINPSGHNIWFTGLDAQHGAVKQKDFVRAE